jgi:hypothetical protein
MSARSGARPPSRWAAALAFVLGLAVSGCGGGSDTVVVNRLVTPEQEAQDLKRALDFGAINQSEYDREIRKLRAGR